MSPRIALPNERLPPSQAVFFRSLCRFSKILGGEGAFTTWLSHLFSRTCCNASTFGMNVCVQSFYRHPHLLLAAFPRSPFQFLERAQKDLWRGFFGSLVGALRLLPAARALRLPFSVNPAPCETGNFSPLPTERLGNFLRAISGSVEQS